MKGKKKQKPQRPELAHKAHNQKELDRIVDKVWANKPKYGPDADKYLPRLGPLDPIEH